MIDLGDAVALNLPFLTASNPVITCTGDAEWDKAVTAWLIADGPARADAAFGSSAKANEAFVLIRIGLEGEFGQRYWEVPEASARLREASEVARAAEDLSTQTYFRPLWRAAAALACVPAPTLAAALFKIELIKREELDNSTSMERDAMEIVAEDMARLAGEADHGQD